MTKYIYIAYLLLCTTAVQSTQMAEKWADFEDDGDRYLLQYRTAADERVREEHAALHNTTLPLNDPFWDTYYPPLGWNCRCTVVQVRKDKYKTSDSAQAIKNGENATTKQPSFRFNPGKTKTCFPDTVSYYKHADSQMKNAVKNTARQTTIQEGKNLYSKIVSKEIFGENINIEFNSKSISHFANDFIHDNKLWVKNELINKLDTALKTAKFVAYERNTKPEKKPTHETYYYFKSKLADGTNVYFSVFKNKVTGKYLFYAISKTLRETATPV